MTIAEKILARHMTTVHGTVRPGDSGFIQVDAGFSHDYTTAPAAALIRSALGREPNMKHPDSIHTFPDHLTLAGSLPGVTSEALAGIRDLREGQKRLARETVFTSTLRLPVEAPAFVIRSFGSRLRCRAR